MPSLLKFASGVVVPKVCIIAAAVVNARNVLGYPGDTVVTSGNDKSHTKGSLHYQGRALDFRVHGLTTIQIQAWAASIRRRLGAEYQVLTESLGTPNAHIHVEYDPQT